jgi:hypothetical protein
MISRIQEGAVLDGLRVLHFLNLRSMSFTVSFVLPTSICEIRHSRSESRLLNPIILILSFSKVLSSNGSKSVASPFNRLLGAAGFVTTFWVKAASVVVWIVNPSRSPTYLSTIDLLDPYRASNPQGQRDTRQQDACVVTVAL